MSIKLVVSDLDGTLITHDDEFNFDISEESIEEINKLKAKEIYFAIATGRYYIDALNIVQRTKIDTLKPLYLIGMNGNQIFDASKNEMIFNNFIQEPKQLIKEIFDTVNKDEPDNVVLAFYCENNLVKVVNSQAKNFSKILDWMTSFENNDGLVKYEIVDSIDIPDNFYKIILTYNVDIGDGSEKIAIINKITSNLRAFITGDNFIEIIPINANKGTAVKFLKDTYKISSEELLVIGDSGNDIDMFKEASFSATRSCARQFVKNSVTNVFDDGPSKFVKNVLKYFVK